MVLYPQNGDRIVTITSHHIEETDAGLDRRLYLKKINFTINFKITKLLL